MANGNEYKIDIPTLQDTNTCAIFIVNSLPEKHFEKHHK